MEVKKIVEGEKLVLYPNGHIDTNNSSDFEDAVDSSIIESNNIVIDFENVEYISSSGLRVLLKAQKKINASNGNLVIRKLSESIKEIFEFTGFLDILTVE